ncbi:hypothetical protein LJ707_00190 [Mucilaginibacter sp. UR6-1]|uniref:hypothetical protein n=1 Tax=Mucilaginibacter sp. UR6-1 TaxID=1435643 RepID=UPI001E50269E|nr:hypothetical protein [Mucilaginibacter sp. UR6-1]MCC8407330.1 hypothetical protein [Mucilaginibacter sp. UR6-1]
MKKYIIAAAIVLTSGITAWSFNKKTEVAPEQVIKIEKLNSTNKAPGSNMHDVSTAD